MLVEVALVEAIYRYPVKSMAGERLEVAELGWHGLEGDRRLALRRLEDRTGFPWLSASKVNFDPDSADPAPEVLKAVVRVHQNTAGVYGEVTRTGRLAVGQTVFLRAQVDRP